MCKIDSIIMDSNLYCEILKGGLMRTIRYYHRYRDLDHVTTIFQQDNDSKHTCRKDSIDEIDLSTFGPYD